MSQFVVKSKQELMAFLIESMGGKSRNSIKSLLTRRLVQVNGQIITQYNHPLQEGDEVSISSSGGKVGLNHPHLKIIYEDDDFIAVDKKEGLLTVTAGSGIDTTAFSILKKYVRKASYSNNIYTVHRLDKLTSGVLLFTKNRDLQRILRENWHDIVKKRSYIAIVEGHVEEDNGHIVTWLTEDEIKLKVYSNKFNNGGKQAISNYRLIKKSALYSMLELELVTGRKNQIRSHMEYIGHPIVGDRKYGSKTDNFSRIALHANQLEFYHPITHKLISFKSEMPKEFTRLMNRR